MVKIAKIERPAIKKLLGELEGISESEAVTESEKTIKEGELILCNCDNYVSLHILLRSFKCNHDGTNHETSVS